MDTDAGGVTVIGLGPMGRAMVRTFLAAGRPTTVWNRTPARADELVAAGAVRAATAAEAVGASELVVLSLPDAARAADEGSYPGELASVLMMGATADHVAGVNRGSGLDTALPDAVKSLYDRAVARGHGRDGWASLIEVIRKP